MNWSMWLNLEEELLSGLAGNRSFWPIWEGRVSMKPLLELSRCLQNHWIFAIIEGREEGKAREPNEIGYNELILSIDTTESCVKSAFLLVKQVKQNCWTTFWWCKTGMETSNREICSNEYSNQDSRANVNMKMWSQIKSLWWLCSRIIVRQQFEWQNIETDPDESVTMRKQMKQTCMSITTKMVWQIKNLEGNCIEECKNQLIIQWRMMTHRILMKKWKNEKKEPKSWELWWDNKINFVMTVVPTSNAKR